MSSNGDSAGASVRVICGPTGAGKSALAMQLALDRSLAVVAADSRQIYRGFDIGTAKPTAGERGHVPHFGIDLVEPSERYSAAEWASKAPAWLATIRAAQREPVIVGGSGFYLRALFQPLFEAPALEPGRRAALQAHLEVLNTEELRRWCRSLDPARAHLGRVQLARAIEVATLTGVSISEWQATRARAPFLAARYLVVDPGRALGEAIGARIETMLAAGWLDETRQLMDRVAGDAPAWSATGYGALRRVVTGEWSVEQARQAILVDTRRYARRQRTWFRHQLHEAKVLRLDPTAPDVLDRARTWWNAED
jgi:tRNA dimethylallyltransferase